MRIRSKKNYIQTLEKKVPKSAITRFIRLYKVKLRRVQRKKQVDRSKYLPEMIKFHTQLREGVIKSGNEKSSYDAKWGRFAPNRRFNVEQIPMPFIVDQKKIYDINIQKTDRRDYRTWLSQPGPGLCKRQCTLQVCISPESKARLAVIFRGKGKRTTSMRRNLTTKTLMSIGNQTHGQIWSLVLNG